MDGAHLREVELARLDGGEVSTEVAEHLRWCARCRSVVADYRWLQGELASALGAVADRVTVPRSNWRDVQTRLRAGGQKQAVGQRLSGVTSAVLAVGLMVMASPIMGTAAEARALPPQATPVPPPASLVASAEAQFTLATPTPAFSIEEADGSTTPSFETRPTPPELPARP